MKKTNELFISLGWEVISAVLWTEGLLNSALDFYLFSLLSLSLSLLSLSLPSSAYEQRGVYTTHREIIDPWRNHWRIVRGWLIPRRWLPGQWLRVERKPVLLLVVSLLDLCIKTRVFCVLIQPPPSFPKNVCVFTYSNKAFLCIKSFWVKF